MRLGSKSHNGWSAIDSFGGGGGGEEREAGRFEKTMVFFVFCFCSIGGRKKDEQCRSKRHRSGLPFFFFFLLYETASFWRKRAVSFK